ncbi:uncharacterized protein [Ptychodera flava]|uniref:uncharacterized protein n=1 Tax=Ptychodera flava TaxID=63121 RepID=UPI00396A3387
MGSQLQYQCGSVCLLLGYFATLVSLITSHWYTLADHPLYSHVGLWTVCYKDYQECEDIELASGHHGHVYVTRACVVAACLVTGLGIIMVTFAFADQVHKATFKIWGYAVVFTALPTLMATLWYHHRTSSLNAEYGYSVGFSFIACQVAMPTNILAGWNLLRFAGIGDNIAELRHHLGTWREYRPVMTM